MLWATTGDMSASHQVIHFIANSRITLQNCEYRALDPIAQKPQRAAFPLSIRVKTNTELSCLCVIFVSILTTSLSLIFTPEHFINLFTNYTINSLTLGKQEHYIL